jgi:hypothetical protein
MEHLQPIDNVRNTKKIVSSRLTKKKPKGIRNGRWKEDVENDVKEMGIVNWGKVF